MQKTVFPSVVGIDRQVTANGRESMAMIKKGFSCLQVIMHLVQATVVGTFLLTLLSMDLLSRVPGAIYGLVTK